MDDRPPPGSDIVGPSLPGRRHAESEAIAAIDSQLARANLPEAEDWVRLRGEIIRQDEWRENQKHIRRAQKVGLSATIGLRFTALGVGGALIAAGFGAAGLVCLGAAIHPLAPELVNRAVRLILGGRDDE